MSKNIVVLGIGPGDTGLLTLNVAEHLQHARHLILQYESHPLSGWLAERDIPFSTMDRFYISSDSFDDLYADMAGYLWEQAESEEISYAVNDPVTDRSVAMLYRKKPSDGKITVLPGIGKAGFLFRYMESCPCLDLSSIAVFSASAFSSLDYSPLLPCCIYDVDNPCLAGEVKIAVSQYLDDHQIICHQSSPDGIHFTTSLLPLFEMDRLPLYNHHTCFLIPSVPVYQRKRHTFSDLVRMTEQLRGPGGYPQYSSQTHASLAGPLSDKARECIVAIQETRYDQLEGLLGDLLFQIVFHASLGSAYDEFSLTDVISGICCKILDSYPDILRPVSSVQAKNPEDPGKSFRDIRPASESVTGYTDTTISSPHPEELA